MSEEATNESENEDETKRRKELLALLLLLLRRTKKALHKQVADFVAASPTSPHASLEDFAESVREILTDAHAKAAYYGRKLAGADEPFGDDDIAFGASVVVGQETYLDAFLFDIERGAYRTTDNAQNETKIAWRAELYGQRLVGTANEAWATTIAEPETLFYWDLDDAQHCETCPDYADNSPYTLETLPAYPGDGSTECGVNCRCSLRTESGELGFRLDELSDETSLEDEEDEQDAGS